MNFLELGVKPEICNALAKIGITDAFQIQELTLPLGLAGKDIIGQAKTGTGKTLGFGIPLLQAIIAPTSTDYATLADGVNKPQAIVLAPTRELAIQVAADLENAATELGLRILCLYGGKAYEPQIDILKSGADVIVGTPGRVLDLANQRHLDLGWIRVLVLDEADEMLDMGFLPDVEKLISKLPTKRQTMLFSATMPGQIINLARRYMNQPVHIRAVNPDDIDNSIVDAIEQHVWRAHQMDKVELVARALQAETCTKSIIFCKTKRNAQKLSDELLERGFSAVSVHGDMGQGAREKSLAQFKSDKANILVATDVAARGIDIDAVSHVINFDCPEDENSYVHRIGRTGRAGASGVAVTFVDWADLPRWERINTALGLPFADPIETYSSSEHVYIGLGIPAGTKGRLNIAKPAEKPAAKVEHKPDSKPKTNQRSRQRTNKIKSK
jgi:superfamily II DNA/RNA helicase